MYPLLFLIGAAAGLVFSGCLDSKENPSEPKISTFPEDYLPEPWLAGPRSTFTLSIPDKSYSSEIHRQLNHSGISDTELNGGYFDFGQAVDPKEQLIGANDSKLHELEIIQAARDLYKKNPENKDLVKIIATFPDQAKRFAEAARRNFTGYSYNDLNQEQKTNLLTTRKSFYQRALSLDPTLADAWLGLGLTLCILEPQNALKARRGLIDSMSSLSDSSRISLQEGLYDLDTQIVKNSLNLIEENEIPREKLNEIESVCREAISISPKGKSTLTDYLALGIVLYAQSQSNEIQDQKAKAEEARQCLLEVIRLDEEIRKERNGFEFPPSSKEATKARLFLQKISLKPDPDTDSTSTDADKGQIHANNSRSVYSAP